MNRILNHSNNLIPISIKKNLLQRRRLKRKREKKKKKQSLLLFLFFVLSHQCHFIHLPSIRIVFLSFIYISLFSQIVFVFIKHYLQTLNYYFVLFVLIDHFRSITNMKLYVFIFVVFVVFAQAYLSQAKPMESSSDNDNVNQ
jgi:ABC-type sugar transport system permease subunit